MNADIDQLTLWTTRNIVRRVDLIHEQLGAAGWSGVPPVPAKHGGDAQSQVRGGFGVLDEWDQMKYGGFSQNDDTKLLRLAPFFVYPGVMLAPWVEDGLVPKPNSSLWVKATYTMNSEVFTLRNGKTATGWDGMLNDAQAVFTWVGADYDMTISNTELTWGDVLQAPPDGLFIRYGQVGIADEKANYAPADMSGWKPVCNMWAPSI